MTGRIQVREGGAHPKKGIPLVMGRVYVNGGRAQLARVVVLDLVARDGEEAERGVDLEHRRDRLRKKPTRGVLASSRVVFAWSGGRRV